MEHIENQTIKDLCEAFDSNIRMASENLFDALTVLECDGVFTQDAVQLWKIHRDLIAFRAKFCFKFTPEKYFQRPTL